MELNFVERSPVAACWFHQMENHAGRGGPLIWSLATDDCLFWLRRIESLW